MRRFLLVAVVLCLLGAVIAGVFVAGNALWWKAEDESTGVTELPPGVKIPGTTKLLDQSTMQRLCSVLEDAGRLTFDGMTGQLKSLAEGDVIVCDASEAAPYGLLRKVANIRRDGDEVTVETSAATLEDAIEKGSIKGSWSLASSHTVTPAATAKGDDTGAERVPTGLGHESGDGTIDTGRCLSSGDTLTPATLAKDITLAEDNNGGELLHIDIDVVVYDGDGNPQTVDDQMSVTGSLELDASLEFAATIDHFQLQQLHFTITTTETAELQVSGEASMVNLKEEVEVMTQNLPTITFWVGWVPVVITPVLTIDVGVNVEVSAGITAGVTQTATATVGLTYNDGDWSPVHVFSKSFQPVDPTVEAGCGVKAYAGPELSFMLYGLAGPYGELDGYLELDAAPLRTPWWELYGGIEANAGVKMEILSHRIADYDPPGLIIEYRELLARAPEEETGEVSGTVIDAVTGSPLEDVTADVYHDETLVGTGVTDSNGVYSVSVPAGSGYRIDFSKAGYITSSYHEVSVEVDTATYLDAVLQIDTGHSGAGDVSGRILNALDGTGVGGLTVDLRGGINVTSGPIVATTTTASDGSYAFAGLSAGHYTAEVSSEGYSTSYFTLVCIGGVSTPDQNATVTPVLSPGETRIILTWGETPSDLDSHLTGPLPDATRFHMYYPLAEANDGSDWPDQVQLDLDDVTSYGPETTTILSQMDGVYRFSVHDYTNRDSTSSYALSDSWAQVRVYRGSDVVATYYVPAHEEGTLWTVFEMRWDTITPINAMSYESTASEVP